LELSRICASNVSTAKASTAKAIDGHHKNVTARHTDVAGIVLHGVAVAVELASLRGHAGIECRIAHGVFWMYFVLISVVEWIKFRYS
jgi:hypothetical protein